MRRYIIILLFVAFCGNIRAAEVHTINNGWKLCSGTTGDLDGGTFVRLPHAWGAGVFGRGNYLLNIDIPASWGGKRVFIRFGAASTSLTLLVNGLYGGRHDGAGTASTFEITPLLRPGERNFLWAMVDNAPSTCIMPAAGDADVYGGLTRGVQLIVSGQVAIAPTDCSSQGIYVSSRRKGEKVFIAETTVKVTSSAEKNVVVSAELIDDGGKTVAAASEKMRVTPKALAATTLSFEVESPRLWDGPADPYLYTVSVKVTENGLTCDSAAVHAGFRDFGYIPGRGFILNGHDCPLRGVSLTYDRPGIGTALQPWHIGEDLALLQEMGVNFVRVAGIPHDPAFYDACDRAGIMVWSSLPFTGPSSLGERAFFNTDAFKKQGRDQLTEIIRQQFNHPSIIIWGIFDCPGARGDDPVPYIKELNALAKKEDPTRYTAGVSSQDGGVNTVTDLILWRHNFGWGEGNPSDISIWLSHLHRSWGNITSAVSYGAGASILHQEGDSLLRPDPAGWWHPERWQTRLHEEYYRRVAADSMLWGVVADNMFDYGSSCYRGGDGSGVNDKGLVTFDRKYRKDAFWFYKANWTHAKPFVYIAEKRWDRRRNHTQQIKAFSNMLEAELLVNGISLGVAYASWGTITWPGVKMQPGKNVVEVRNSGFYDRAEIFIEPSGL